MALENWNMRENQPDLNETFLELSSQTMTAWESLPGWAAQKLPAEIHSTHLSICQERNWAH